MHLDPHALRPGELYRFLISAIVPRPIAFVSSRGADGTTNLAPFSYFNAISSTPPLVGIAFSERPGDPKDSLRNILETREFVVNVVSEALLDAMVRTSGDWPRGTSEFAITGLTEAASVRVAAPSVAESPLQLECRLHHELPLGNSRFVVGEVVFARVRDELLTDGRVDPLKLAPVGRLGGDLYSLTREVAARPRPRVQRTTGVEG